MSLSRHNSLSSIAEHSLLTQNKEWQQPQLPVRFSVSNPPPALSDFPAHHTAAASGTERERASRRPGNSSSTTKAKRKKASSAGEAAVPQKAQQLPPLDWQLAERRLEELHKVAAGSRALHALSAASRGFAAPRPALVDPDHGAGFSPRQQTVPLSSRERDRERERRDATLSGTEADFLVRQIQSADLSQLSLLSNGEELAALSQGLGSVWSDLDLATLPTEQEEQGEKEKKTKKKTLPLTAQQQQQQQRQQGEREREREGAAAVVAEALREKIVALERQVAALNATVQKKERELDKKDQRVRSLVSENDKLRTEREGEMKSVEADHQRELLRLKDQHSQEKAALFANADLAVSAAAAAGSSPSRGASTQIEGYRQVLAQLDKERVSNRERAATWEDERRTLERNHAARLLALEQSLSSEAKLARAALTRAEDTIASLQEQVREGERERETLQCQQRVWEDSKRAAHAEKDKLKAELQMMQQSVAASYRLDTSVNQSLTLSPSKSTTFDNSTSLSLAQTQRERLPADVELSQRLRDAQNDAKLKQLLNKLEFLKAQLESEKRICDELRDALQERERDLAAQREDADRRVRETMRDAEQRMAQREQEILQGYETRMAELTTLQRDLQSLRSEREERDRDAASLRQREETLNAQLQRANVALAAQKRESESVAAQLQTLQREREEEQRNGAKLSQEAVLRRLDNERHYLKSQLSAEIALKTEMQTALTRTQTQLAESQRQWREDVQTLKDSLSQLHREKDEAYTQRESERIREERERAHLAQSVQDLKDGFVKARDALRAEQLRIETLSLERARLLDEKDSLSREMDRLAQRERERDDEQREREREQRALWDATEAAHAAELHRLREDLQKQHLSVSQGAVALLREKDAQERERESHGRAMACLRMASALRGMHRKRVYRALSAWRLRTALLAVGAQVKTQLHAVLAEKKRESEREREKALAALRDELRVAFEDEKSALRRESERERDDLGERMEREREQALTAEREKHAAALRQCEEDCVYDVQSERKEKEKDRARFLAERESERERHAALLQSTTQRVEREAAREKEDALRQLTESLINAHTQELAQLDAERERERERERAQFADELHGALAKSDSERVAALHGAETRWAAQREREHAEWLAERETERETERVAQSEREKELLAQFAAQSERERAALREQFRVEEEERLRALRGEWLAERERERETERETAAAERERERNAWAAESERERDKAVKREANKWRQVLRESDTQRELETSQSALAERARAEKDFAAEKERLQRDLALSLQRERDLAAAQLAASQRDAERERERERESALREKDVELRALRETLREEATRQSESARESERERLAALHEAAMLAERERQSALRRDFAAQTSSYAAERERLLGEVARAERERDALAAERESEREVWERERESERLLHETLVDAATQSERERGERERERERAAWREEQERLVAAEREIERERGERERERERQALAEENERLVSQLEDTLRALKDEKLSLAQSLDSLSARLTDSEDALYDARQREKSLSKEFSLSRWQAAARLLSQQKRATTLLRERDERGERALQANSATHQAKWDALCLALLQALRSLQTVEEQRVAVWQALTQHRVDDLKDLKKRVSLLEGEMQRVSLEKDALEEQRATLQQDIERCAEEVQEQEALARQHTQESSMTSNGRVNVAHARKKKRLDQEIERLLEMMEHKRGQIGDIDGLVAQKQALREEKEAALMEVERELVGILIEQQRIALKSTQEMASNAEKAKLLATAQRLPFPLTAKQQVSPALLDELKKQWKHEDEN